ncbi:MAG: cob(I)yrinic acid a,c-diamide adenosyltransferase [Gallionellaceae bacterium]
MANRLSKITTRTGDDGTTGLADGRRVAKNSVRITAIGSVDELNSQLGVLLAATLPADISALLLRVQNELFDLGGALSLPEREIFPETHTAQLDAAIAHYNAGLPPLKEFVLPGGTRSAAQCHVARSVARRAERDLVALAHSETVPQAGLPYLNRLSDLLFILCRVLNRAAKQEETMWARKAP